jgi:hypothetical protein
MVIYHKSKMPPKISVLAVERNMEGHQTGFMFGIQLAQLPVMGSID